ncbi:MAG: hypothetical protein J6K88_00955 [Oscillospiraceae bacterium]|nr:hypothetical protein [Oscillospiraceae bacterium]
MEDLIDELGILTYLRNLVLADSEGNINASREERDLRVGSAYYLLDLQEEAVSNFRELFHKEDFATKG